MKLIIKNKINTQKNKRSIKNIQGSKNNIINIAISNDIGTYLDKFLDNNYIYQTKLELNTIEVTLLNEFDTKIIEIIKKSILKYFTEKLTDFKYLNLNIYDPIFERVKNIESMGMDSDIKEDKKALDIVFNESNNLCLKGVKSSSFII